MGFIQWLNDNISSPILKAGQWLGEKIVKPTLGFLKNVPGVGSVIQAAEPLVNTIGKTWNASAKLAEENKQINAGKNIKRQQVDYPSAGEWIGAVQSGAEAVKKFKGL